MILNPRDKRGYIPGRKAKEPEERGLDYSVPDPETGEIGDRTRPEEGMLQDRDSYLDLPEIAERIKRDKK